MESEFVLKVESKCIYISINHLALPLIFCVSRAASYAITCVAVSDTSYY